MRLSPSSLNIFKNCPKCFWLEKNAKTPRPRGIFPSLPGGFDRIIKQAMDTYRSAKEVPFSVEGVSGLRFFQDQRKLDQWRNWRTGLKAEFGEHCLIGAFDDLLITRDKYVPFDYKSKGSAANLEDATKYYQTQLELYALMLQQNSYRTENFGVLLFFSPESLDLRTDPLHANLLVQSFKIEISTDRAKTLFDDAIACLEGLEPLAGPECEYCLYAVKRGALILE